MKEELGFSRRRTFLVEFSSTQDLRPPPSWWGWGGMQEASGGKAFLSFFSLQETLYLGLFTGWEVVGCRCEETRQLALHWGDRGAPHIGDWRVTRLLQNATSWDISFLPCIEETGVAGRRQLTLVKTHASHSDWNTLGSRVTLVLQNASSSGEWEISFLPRRHLHEGKLSKITARRHLPDVHWHRFYIRLGCPCRTPLWGLWEC